MSRKTLSAPLLAAVARMAPLGVQLLATPFVIATLGPSAYSVWVLMMTTINLMLTADLEVVGVMQRYHGLARGHRDPAWGGRVTGTVMAVLGVILVIVTVLGPWLARGVLAIVDVDSSMSDEAFLVFRHTGTIAVLQLIGLSFSSYLAAHDRFASLAAVSLSARATLILGIGITLSGGYGLTGLVIAAYVDAGMTIVLGAWACRGHLWTDVRRFTTLAEGREMWGYAWRSQASSLGFVAQRELDVVMAAMLLPSAALATIAASAPLAASASLAPVVLLTPLFTRLSVMTAEGRPATVAAAGAAEGRWFTLAIPYGAVMLAVLPPAAVLWIGPEIDDVAPVSAVLSLGFLLGLASSVTAVLVRAVGLPGIETRAYVVYVAVKVVAGIAMAKAFGALGLAAAGVVASVFMVLSIRRNARRRVGTSRARVSKRAIGFTAFVAVPAAVASWLVLGSDWSRLVALVAIAGIGAGAGAVLLWAARRVAA